jgi:DHA1 family inner membrane transport protein
LLKEGHARRATRVNAATLGGTLIAKAICGSDPIAVVAVAVGTTALAGLYVPSLMTAIYNEAKASPCPLRFHFAAEIGWDIGGSLACLAAAALCAYGASLQAVILLALPMVAVQTFLLDARYAERNSAIGLVGTELPGR